MRIKFLSFIASFFIVSFVITSCLDEENNIELSKDATIHAFSLDTIGYGKTYKFTIDQLRGEIYNQDSLPVHADTIVDKILIKTLTTVSGIVTMKDKNGEDSIININDSMDFRKPVKIRVWSSEGLAEFNKTKTKDYTITVRIHQFDPDSLNWEHKGTMDPAATEAQKSVRLGDKAFTYNMQGGALKVSASSDMITWNTQAVEGINQMPHSLMALNHCLLATVEKKLYVSEDGITWNPSDKIEGSVVTLISQLPIKGQDDILLTYIKEENGKQMMYAAQVSSSDEFSKETSLGETDSRFPVENLSYATFPKGKGFQNIVVGKHQPEITTTVDGKEVPAAVSWGFDGTTWAEIGTTSSTGYCPGFNQPTVVFYNDLLYCRGEKFESIYVSDSEGFAWEKADKKFAFPMHNWFKSSITVSTPAQPEFRGRTNYSVIQDTEKQYIYILFGKEDNVSFKEKVTKKEGDKVTTTTETRTYRHDSEVWSGRLNQLWFDLANAGK